MWAAGILMMGCSSASGGSGAQSAPVEAGDEGAQVQSDAADETRADAGIDAPADVGSDAGAVMDAEPSEAATLDVQPGPFEACAPMSPGDGGTRCALYSVSVDGSIVDEAGDPTGLAVSEACVPGQPCAGCLDGYLFSGVCE